MTEEKLNSVRQLNKRLKSARQRLAVLRQSAEDLVKVLDGMPKAQSPNSQVERLAVLCADQEALVRRLRAAMELSAINLIDDLRRIPLTPLELEILILRYALCENFRDIGFEKKMSDARVYQIHREGVIKVVGHREDLPADESAQLESEPDGVACEDRRDSAEQISARGEATETADD